MCDTLYSIVTSKSYSKGLYGKSEKQWTYWLSLFSPSVKGEVFGLNTVCINRGSCISVYELYQLNETGAKPKSAKSIKKAIPFYPIESLFRM